jgi:hypothetical protein
MALAFCGLTGCAVMPPQTQQRYQEGWHEGVITRIGRADQLGEPLAHDCRSSDAGARPGQLFAEVSYPHRRTLRTVIGVVSEASALAVDQKVWVSVRDCRPIEAK